MRHRIYSVLLGAFLAIGIVAQEAGAVTPPNSWRMQAIVVAEETWDLPCSPLVVVPGRPAAVEFESDVENDRVAGWATPGDCTVHYNEAETWLGFPDFCTLVAHETGHVAGFGHTDIAGGLMEAEGILSREVNWLQGRHRWRRVVSWGGAYGPCVRPVDRR